MRRLFFYLALLTGVSSAMGDNLYVEDVVIPSGGSISVPIRYHLETEGLYGGYQFEVTLPDGITAVLDSDGDPTFTVGNSLDNSFLSFSGLDSETGNSLFCGFSENGKSIQNTDGTLITLSLTANNALENGTKLTGRISKAALGNIDGETTVPMDDVVFNITVGEADAPWTETDISEMDNVLYVEGAEGIANGRMTFFVKMKNSVVAEGFFFRMYMPEGFTLMENLDGKLDVSLYSDGGRVDKSKIEFDDPVIDENDGSLVINAYGKNGQTINGNDGEVVRIRVHVPEGMPVGDYPILIKNGGVSDNMGTMWPKGTKPVITCKLHVADKVRGDANGDAIDTSASPKNNDAVNAGDYITIIHYIQGLPYTNDFDKTAADANGDGVVNGADLTAISNLKKYDSVSKPAAGSSRVAKSAKEREAE